MKLNLPCIKSSDIPGVTQYNVSSNYQIGTLSTMDPVYYRFKNIGVSNVTIGQCGYFTYYGSLVVSCAQFVPIYTLTPGETITLVGLPAFGLNYYQLWQVVVNKTFSMKI